MSLRRDAERAYRRVKKRKPDLSKEDFIRGYMSEARLITLSHKDI